MRVDFMERRQESRLALLIGTKFSGLNQEAHRLS